MRLIGRNGTKKIPPGLRPGGSYCPLARRSPRYL
jgi:hypothetical protein